MREHFMPALRFTLVLTVLTGGIYPAAITELSGLFFPRQAEGSMIRIGGDVVGSEIIGQKFEQPWYFHGRPSAAGGGYDAANSGGSNLGPTNQKLVDRMKAGIERFRRENPDFHGSFPADFLSASASGLDPHISPASASIQAARIAKFRGTTPAEVQRLIVENTEGRQLGLLGEPRVNVLKLNIALDRLSLPGREVRSCGVASTAGSRPATAGK